MSTKQITIVPDDTEITYPSEWLEGRELCVENDINYDPSAAYPKKHVPLDAISKWFEAGLARNLQLYDYGEMFFLEFRLAGFDTIKEPIWINSQSVFLDCNDYAGADAIIESIGLKAIWDSRLSRSTQQIDIVK